MFDFRNMIKFVMGLFALLAVWPRRLKGTTAKQELAFAAAGLCGVCLYYLLENIALTYTMASNVGVIISVAPFFTALLSHLFLHQDEKLRPGFFLGFAVAMAGIILISFNGSSLQFGPTGDLLTLLAAFLWACYYFQWDLTRFANPVYLLNILFLGLGASASASSPGILP